MRPAASALLSQLRQIGRLDRPAPLEDLSSTRATASSATSTHEIQYTDPDHYGHLVPPPGYSSPVPSTPPPPYVPSDNLTVRIWAKLIEKHPDPHDSWTLHRWSKNMTMYTTTSFHDFKEASLRLARGADRGRAVLVLEARVGMRVKRVERVRCCKYLVYRRKRLVEPEDWDGVMGGLIAGRFEGLAITYWIDSERARTTAWGRPYLS